MTQFVIGAISEMDVPMNPAAKGLYSLTGYMTKLPFAAVQRERVNPISFPSPHSVPSCVKHCTAKRRLLNLSEHEKALRLHFGCLNASS